MTRYPLSLPAGNPLITLSHPKKSLWVIELHNGQDSLLTHELINQGLKPALNAVEKTWRESWRLHNKDQQANKDEGKGTLIVVGRKDQDKFFSNGLDFANSQEDPNFIRLTFDPLLERILTFPSDPHYCCNQRTLFCGGLMLSMACDYRVVTDGSKRNCWLSMNEVHVGISLPPSGAAILRSKFGPGLLKRKIALEGHRFTPQEAQEAGIVDYIVNGGTAAVLARAEELADQWSVNAQGGVWGTIKTELYRDVLETIHKDARPPNHLHDDAAAKARL
ncbi:ClpP/crotonase-like domain-containing protein [Rhodocollybia butyracea]|uniref:ClpP/crotonase-like domain-containing protein n=1 Tax=Rhodocollybia butyracea TaxID=206335 RepID=A0A9P5PF81_9AGAR|nr:ClpP/crotonase-like domain-containing protein [Rhodocollybia butyracea]